METKTASDILKMAILMEKRGKAFYDQIAQQTQDEDVRRIFSFMADEEQLHIEFLSKQFSHYEKTQEFAKNEFLMNVDESAAEAILSEGIKMKISASGYEAAAISAAIDMETKAIEVYANRAQASADPNEKELFTFLADWEKGHHKVLNQLNNELMEKIWNDNQFWPF